MPVHNLAVQSVASDQTPGQRTDRVVAEPEGDSQLAYGAEPDGVHVRVPRYAVLGTWKHVRMGILRRFPRASSGDVYRNLPFQISWLIACPCIMIDHTSQLRPPAAFRLYLRQVDASCTFYELNSFQWSSMQGPLLSAQKGHALRYFLEFLDHSGRALSSKEIEAASDADALGVARRAASGTGYGFLILRESEQDLVPDREIAIRDSLRHFSDSRLLLQKIDAWAAEMRG